MSKFTYIDLFAGIGGFRTAIDGLGGKCIGFSEIDKPCIETYLTNYGDSEEDNFGDITKIKELPEVDLLVGGVPCQSWSVAGKMRGFEDPRGKLWWDAIRLVEQSKPKVFIFENVKGLFDPRNKNNLNLIVENLENAGYLVKVQLLNSYDFGVPQNRTRTFIVGFRSDYKKEFENFSFPKGEKVHANLAKFLDGIEYKEIEKRKFSPQEIFGDYVPKARNAFQKEDEVNDFFVMCDTRNGHTSIHSWDLRDDLTDKHKTILNGIMKNRRKKQFGPKDGNPLSLNDIQTFLPDTSQADLDFLTNAKLLKKIDNKYSLANSKNSSGINGIYRMYMPYSKIFSTLTATGTKDVVVTDYIDIDTPEKYKEYFIEKIIKKGKYRPITVKETQRIQGFPDAFVPHRNEALAKKQFGNAVSPPVISALMKAILETDILNSKRNNYVEKTNQ